MSKTLPLKAFEHLCTQQWPEVEMYTYTKEDANYRFRNLNIHFNELAKFFVQEKKLISTS